jgi:signal transduction histidine kinase
MVEISLSDTGQGIPPEVAGNIFHPYFTTKEKGTGLGLAITQIIIQGHGGSISADSTPGQGTAFIIRLPLQEIASGE